MAFLKKIPLIAFLFLLSAYSFVGWFMAGAVESWQKWVYLVPCAAVSLEFSRFCGVLASRYALWLGIAGLIVAIALALIHPLTEIKSVFGDWLQSDAKAFLSVIAIAFFLVLLLTRLDFINEGIILIAPGLLTRLELQLSGYSDWQAFSIIAGVCLVSYSLGILSYQYLHNNPLP
ncbi:hypothetical protein [Lusitaniella coriacea]|uniref:hypothetical protein n=1 Tax=Lusitaniella coriacea TaxID=1983105 RepID=UPI003CF2DA67